MVQPPEVDPHATRATLLLRLAPDAAGRELAWREFYEVYGPIIGGFARNMGAAGHDIPDLVQEVMLGFFGVSPNFEYNPTRGRFRGYLKTCTWRAFQKRLGRKLQLAGRGIDQIADDDLQVEQAWNDVWESEKLRKAVDVVREKYMARPDRARTFQAFEMYALLDRPPEEIASELEMSVESVHQAKSRVSKAIKAAMDAMDGTMG
jgi:RNA polymerase sigma-70 factor, ECF subfamily